MKTKQQEPIVDNVNNSQENSSQQYETMVGNAEGQIASLERERHEARTRLVSAQDVLREAHCQRQVAQEALGEAERRQLRAQEVHNQAQTYANVALGTMAEKTAIQRLAHARADLKAATQRLKEVTQESEAQAQRLTEQEARAHATIAEKEDILREIAGRQGALEQVRNEAHTAHGQEVLQAVTARLADLESRVAESTQHLIELKVELTVAREECLLQLTAWPGLQEQLRGAYPEMVSDPTIRLLQAMLSFLDVFEQEGGRVNRQVFPLFAMSAQQLTDILDFNGHRSHGTLWLDARKHALEAALKQAQEQAT